MRGWLVGLVLAVGVIFPARAETVSTALVLALDYSSSMTAVEKQWQIDALVEIFGNPDIEARIGRTYRGTVAIAAIRFSSNTAQFIPWTVLREGDGSVQRFRQFLMAEQERVHARTTPPLTDGTWISRGMLHGGALLEGMDADRLVVDVQTDGYEGEGPMSEALLIRINAARDTLEEAGIICNVLLMGVPQARQDTLREYHEENTITSTGRVWDARDYDTYLAALQQKILLELF